MASVEKELKSTHWQTKTTVLASVKAMEVNSRRE